ncbi:MAG: hypothetical protein GF350_11850 [Chitinivibrionales bacterium]|nr:hypothetical protein [Chitinivibrionales bacterium]
MNGSNWYISAVLLKIASYTFSAARFGFYRSLIKKGLIRNRFADVVILSYPKSGRTWLRVMLEHVPVCLKWTHDDAEALYRLERPFSVSPILPDTYRGKKVILLARDPRDILVSSYFHAARRERIFTGSLSEFLSDSRFGIRNIIACHTAWFRGRNIPGKFMTIYYKDLHQNPVESLNRIFAFLNTKPPSQRKLKNIVNLYSFSSMKKLEKSGIFRVRHGRYLRPANKNDTNSFKVRKGKTRGYVDYLSREEIEWCTGLMNATNCQLYKRYLTGK